MTDDERAQVEALIARVLHKGASAGYLRLASLVNKIDKPSEVDVAHLDPTSTFKE